MMSSPSSQSHVTRKRNPRRNRKQLAMPPPNSDQGSLLKRPDEFRSAKVPLPRKLILASASPRRREILEAARIEFDVLPTAVVEQQKKGESARKFAARMAIEKAEAALSILGQRPNSPGGTSSDLPILGADTVVAIGRQTFGKPASPQDARQMLRLLSGRQHKVLTGLCLLYPPTANATGQSKRESKMRESKTEPRLERSGIPKSPRSSQWKRDERVASTTVKFYKLSVAEIEHYIATAEPLDKAGAYAIQGAASKYVEWINGCYFNVVGLPISMLYQMLKKLESSPSEPRP